MMMSATEAASSKLGFSPAITLQMKTESDVDFSVRMMLSLIAVPMAYINAADSPMILPMASNTPDKIPGIAAFKTILNVVWVRFAPSASDAWRKSSGMALSASSVAEMTIGKTITERVSAPEKILPPSDLVIEATIGMKSAAPNSP